jgi:putative alpha-1,2-mannosidase
VTVNRDNGSHIYIDANNNDKVNRYIKSMKLDNVVHNDAYISSVDLLSGNHLLQFDMTNEPTT